MEKTNQTQSYNLMYLGHFCYTKEDSNKVKQQHTCVQLAGIEDRKGIPFVRLADKENKLSCSYFTPGDNVVPADLKVGSMVTCEFIAPATPEGRPKFVKIVGITK